MRTIKNRVVKTCLAGLVAAAFLCAGLPQAKAAVLANYAFQSSNGTSTDTDLSSTAGTFGATGLTTSFATGPFAGATTSIRATASSMPTALTTTSYFSFVITPTAGGALQLGGTAALTFTFSRATGFGGNEFNWAVRSSLDNYTANLGTGATTGSGTAFNASINLGSQFNLTSSSAVTFRIYAFDGGATGTGTWGYLDNVVLNGTVTPVPEPVNVALGVFGLCAVVGGVGRRYLRSRS
jgi:hypothetical protein